MNNTSTVICLKCGCDFTPVRSSRKYCNESCRRLWQDSLRRQASAKRRRKCLLSKSSLFEKTGFARYLVGEVRRAGTLEVLRGLTSSDLLELFRISKQRTVFSGIDRGSVNNRFELSHIVAVKDLSRLGLLHPLNLVICPALFNRARSTKSSRGLVGKSVPKVELNPKLNVSPTDSYINIIRRIKKYLGSSVLTEFYATTKLHMTQREALLKKLAKFEVDQDDLKNLSIEELNCLLEKFGGRSSVGFSRAGKSSFEVALSELQRFKMEESPLYFCCKVIVDSRMHLDIARKEFDSFLLNQIWNALHGDDFSLTFNGHLVSEYPAIVELKYANDTFICDDGSLSAKHPAMINPF